ncbi:hypothetical protein [Gemmatimonas sp.]|uniref:hypothetical protein n=1 Tax=Gemmatimonas sp. TaxID=1962908 RepID=UPI00356934ED
MANDTKPSPAVDTPSPSPHRWRSAFWIGTAALLGLVAGVLLQYAQLDRARRQVADTSAALQAARLEATLSAAVIEAQSGRFEVARRHASDFYTGLQRRLLPVLNGAPQGDVRTMLAERDSIITSLARNDPASPGTLTGVLERLRETIHRAALDSSNVPGAP